MSHDLHLLESDSPKHGGLLIRYGWGYDQQLAWVDKPEIPAHEMGKTLAARALQALLDRGDGSRASDVNWASMAAACGEQFRVWRARVAGRGAGVGGGAPV